MNERIEKLAEQAGFENGHHDRNGNSLSYELEKFAKLIVRECIDQCAVNGSNAEWVNGVRWAANQIKQHFGVEE